MLHSQAEKRTIFVVALRIIWPNFLRAVWHICATSWLTGHKAFGRRFDPSTNCFVNCSSQLLADAGGASLLAESSRHLRAIS